MEKTAQMVKIYAGQRDAHDRAVERFLRHRPLDFREMYGALRDLLLIRHSMELDGSPLPVIDDPELRGEVAWDDEVWKRVATSSGLRPSRAFQEPAALSRRTVEGTDRTVTR